MKSLRREIGVWLFGVSTMIGLGAATISFISARDEARRFFDQQLRIMAHNVDVTQSNVPVQVMASLNEDPDDDFAIQVWNGSGVSIRVWPAGLDLPQAASPGCHDIQSGNVSWRTYAITTSAHSVQVSQLVVF